MGGSPSIPQRNFPREFGQIFHNAWPQQRQAYQNWWQNEPLLSASHDYALGNLQNLGPGYTDALSALLPTLQSQGALTSEQDRDVTQATRAGFAARGNVVGNQALGSELLNRDQYRQQRFTQALGQAGMLQGLQGGALQQALGVEQGQVGTFATLMNPLLSYGSDLNSSNQNAAAAQAIAGGNKNSGLLGGLLNAGASAAAAY